MATPPIAVEFTVEGLEQVKEAFRAVAAESKLTSESAKQMDISYKRLALSIAHVGTASLAIESIFERVASGQMSIIEGVLRLIPTLITLASSIWAVVTAEKARAVASAIAHGIATLGAALPAIAAAAIVAAGIAIGATAQIPSKEYGGFIEKTGIYQLHKGELVVPEKNVEKLQRFSEVIKSKSLRELITETEKALPTTLMAGAYEHVIRQQPLTLVFDIHDNHFASDYDADRTGERIVDKLRRAGVI